VELGYNEDEYFGPKCSFTTQVTSVITKPGYNEQIWPAQQAVRYNQVSLYNKTYCIGGQFFFARWPNFEIIFNSESEF